MLNVSSSSTSKYMLSLFFLLVAKDFGGVWSSLMDFNWGGEISPFNALKQRGGDKSGCANQPRNCRFSIFC